MPGPFDFTSLTQPDPYGAMAGGDPTVMGGMPIGGGAQGPGGGIGDWLNRMRGQGDFANRLQSAGSNLQALSNYPQLQQAMQQPVNLSGAGVGQQPMNTQPIAALFR